jgi:hypothetical protein
MKFCGDWNMYLRILLISDVAYIAEPLNNFRLHGASTFLSHNESAQFLYEVKETHRFVKKITGLSVAQKLKMVAYETKIRIAWLRTTIGRFISRLLSF